MVSGFVRVEQGHGDEAGVDRGEERHDVIQALGGQDATSPGSATCCSRAASRGDGRRNTTTAVRRAVTGLRVVDVAVDQPVRGPDAAGVCLDEVDQGVRSGMTIAPLVVVLPEPTLLVPIRLVVDVVDRKIRA